MLLLVINIILGVVVIFEWNWRSPGIRLRTRDIQYIESQCQPLKSD